jgi:hypothetical protein
MRRLTALLGLGAVLVAAGCNSWTRRYDAGGAAASADVQAPVPQVGQLVAYLNENAARYQGVQSNSVVMDCRQGLKSIGLDALMACQKPRDFRLRGKILGQPGVDIGSNGEEFWYWISKDDPPYVYHCAYQDMARGARLPFPFQPDMVVAALGMGEYDPDPARYDLKVNGQTLELSQAGTNPQGQPVRRVTVFARTQQLPPRPQVLEHILRDAQGHDVCKATVLDVQNVPTSAGKVVAVPHRVKLAWPAQKMEMTMTINAPTVYERGIEPERAAMLFSRRDLAHLQSFDMARRALDAGPGAGLQRVRGLSR